MTKKILWTVFILAGLFLVASGIALFLENPSFSFPYFESPTKINVAVIPIYGEIAGDNIKTDIFSIEKTTPKTISKFIDDVKKDSTIKAVILDINSPGGSVVPSAQIADIVKRLNKTKYAVISEIGASGAYWAASSADKIIASPLSITGSVGVTSSYLDFSELMDKYGVNYNQLAVGELKEIGNPYTALTKEQRAVLEKKIKIIHEHFLNDVKNNRKLSDENVKKISSAEFYLGTEAKELGLVDALGDKQTAVDMLKAQFNATDVQLIEYKEPEGFLSLLTKASSFYIGKGIAAGLVEQEIQISKTTDIRT